MKVKALAICLGALIASSAQATVTLADWKTAGDGLVARDTATGLDWLNLTVTKGFFYNEITASLATTYAGFRYATVSEVERFWADTGITTRYPGVASQIQNLTSLWGRTVASGPDNDFYAITGTYSIYQTSYLETAGGNGEGGGTYYVNATNTNSAPNGSFGPSRQVIASALVRITPAATAAVPEPATWAMFIGGFGLVGAAMRRRHRVAVRFT